MFIVIDWIDWSWKWTQIELVKKYLENIWKTVKLLDYPRYWCESSFMVKKYLNWEYWKEISPKLSSIFFAIDRYDSFFDNKFKDFKNYDYIISNRYVSSNMIHQAWKIKSDIETNEFLNWLYDLEFNIFGIPKPDKVIFLNVTPEVSQKLILKKSDREYLKNWNKMDLHESDLNHLKNAREKAMKIVNIYNDWVKIDCIKDWNILPINEITNKILTEIFKEKNNN